MKPPKILFALAAATLLSCGELTGAADQELSIDELASICPADLFEGDRTPDGDMYRCEVDDPTCLKRCDKGWSMDCYSSALALQAVDRDAEANNFFKAACRAGYTSGCTNAAATSLNVLKDTSDECLLRTFQMTCAANDPWGCTMTAHLLSNPHYEDRFPRDLDAALAATKGSCRFGPDDRACQDGKTVAAEISEMIGAK